MAIDLATGFNIGSKDVIDERQVLTLEQMKNLDETIYPDNYFAICKDNGKLYIFNASNEIDEETGKFRKVSSNESVDPSIFQKSNDDSLMTEDKTIVGAINELENSKLDKPETEGTAGQILVLQDDGSLAYQDNISEFDDTELREELEVIKERFKERMRGNLPLLLEKMLETKHGMYDNLKCNIKLDSNYDIEKIINSLN